MTSHYSCLGGWLAVVGRFRGVPHGYPWTFGFLPNTWFELVGVSVKDLTLVGPKLVAPFTHPFDHLERALPPGLQFDSSNSPGAYVPYPLTNLVVGSVTAPGVEGLLQVRVCSVQGSGYLDINLLHSVEQLTGPHTLMGGRPGQAAHRPLPTEDDLIWRELRDRIRSVMVDSQGTG